MTDKAIYVLAHIGYFSLFFGLLPLLVILTISFRYVILIEHRVATEGGAISAARVIWTGKVIGRLMRSSNVFAYLVLRSTPFPFLRRRASLLGNPCVLLPKSWQAWIIVPFFLLYSSVLVTVVVNLVLSSVA